VNDRRPKSSTTGCTTPSFSSANGGGGSSWPRASRTLAVCSIVYAPRRSRGAVAPSGLLPFTPAFASAGSSSTTTYRPGPSRTRQTSPGSSRAL
jgi:hypothetical protein